MICVRIIKFKEGNEEEGYCLKKCRVRSGWVEGKLDKEVVWLWGKVEDVELFEELEERGEVNLEVIMKEELKMISWKELIVRVIFLFVLKFVLFIK